MSVEGRQPCGAGRPSNASPPVSAGRLPLLMLRRPTSRLAPMGGDGGGGGGGRCTLCTASDRLSSLLAAAAAAAVTKWLKWL